MSIEFAMAMYGLLGLAIYLCLCALDNLYKLRKLKEKVAKK